MPKQTGHNTAAARVFPHSWTNPGPPQAGPQASRTWPCCPPRTRRFPKGPPPSNAVASERRRSVRARPRHAIALPWPRGFPPTSNAVAWFFRAPEWQRISKMGAVSWVRLTCQQAGSHPTDWLARPAEPSRPALRQTRRWRRPPIPATIHRSTAHRGSRCLR